MSLSEFCDREHQRTQARLGKLLLLSLAGSFGLHLALSGFVWRGGEARSDRPAAIELLVIDPERSPEAAPERTPDKALPANVAATASDPAPAAAPAPIAAAPAQLFEPGALSEEGVESDEKSDPADDREDEERAAGDTDGDTDGNIAIETDIEKPGKRGAKPNGSDEGEDEGGEAGRGDSDEGSGDGNGSTNGEGESDAGGNASSDGTSGEQTAESGNGNDRGSRTVACRDCILPDYPDSALDAGFEGTPRVQVDIAPDGTVRGVTLMSSSGNDEMDRAAIEAARRSRFEPMDGGASVPIDYDFIDANSAREAREDRRSVEVPTYGGDASGYGYSGGYSGGYSDRADADSPTSGYSYAPTPPENAAGSAGDGGDVGAPPMYAGDSPNEIAPAGVISGYGTYGGYGSSSGGDGYADAGYGYVDDGYSSGGYSDDSYASDGAGDYSGDYSSDEGATDAPSEG